MTIQLELDPRLEERLISKAELHRQTAEQYLHSLVEDALAEGPARYNPAKTQEEFRAAMARLRQGGATILPADTTWDRESIYDDHD
jgi:hypothetical protein